MGGGEHRTRPGVEARAPVADRSGCRCRAGCGAKVDEEGCDLSEEVAAASELAHDVRIGDAARARCIALFTDAGVVSRMSATSAALNPSTSRRISTARWEPGRCYSAAMKASSTLSRCRYADAGSGSSSTGTSSGPLLGHPARLGHGPILRSLIETRQHGLPSAQSPRRSLAGGELHRDRRGIRVRKARQPLIGHTLAGS